MPLREPLIPPERLHRYLDRLRDIAHKTSYHAILNYVDHEINRIDMYLSQRGADYLVQHTEEFPQLTAAVATDRHFVVVCRREIMGEKTEKGMAEEN